MFEHLPSVPTADELVDRAFNRASKVSVSVRSEKRTKTLEHTRVETATQVMTDALERIVEGFPSFDELGAFHRDLVAATVDLDATREALGSVNWGARTIERLGNEAMKAIREAPVDAHDRMRSEKSAFYGRAADVLDDVDEALATLREARQALTMLPTIDPEAPTVVVAGFPNVGKSSLLRELTRATPEVAEYPFTSKKISIGHLDVDGTRVQVIDTPGLLDRPLEERNEIERRAALALEHLRPVVVFVLDPSEYCGFPLDQQTGLLRSLRAELDDARFVVVENKADLAATGDRLAVSCESGEGLDELRDAVRDALQAMGRID